MAEFAERTPARAAAPPVAVEEDLTKIHPRQLLHGGITFALLVVFLVIGPALFNTIEPRILGLPFYVFWTVLLLPIVNFINLVLFARFMIAREKRLKELNLEPWR